MAAVDITGASAIGAQEALALIFESSAANDLYRASGAYIENGLTAGSNTFTMKYKVTAGTGTFVHRRMSVFSIT